METKWLNVLVLTVFLCVSLEITHGSNTTTETAKSTGRQARTVTATSIHDFTSQDISGSLSSNDTVSTVATHVSTEISANPGTDTSAETTKATNNPIGITPSKENGSSSKGSTPKTNGSTSKVSKNEVSSTQKPSSENPLANLANMVKLLGNFLPKKSVDLISAMTQNQSAWTVTNALNVLLPLGKMAGVRALSQGGVSDACSRDMGLIIDGILGREEWALKMLDASLKIPANLYDTVLSGTPKALGDYDECLAVHGKATGHEINAKYCRAAFKLPLPPGTMRLTPNTGTAYLGLCVSKSCSSSDVGLIISNLEKQVLNGTVPYQPTIECAEKKPWSTEMIVVTEDEGLCRGRRCNRRNVGTSPILIVRVFEHCLYDNFNYKDILNSDTVFINNRMYKLAGMTLHKSTHYCAICVHKGRAYWYDGLVGRLSNLPKDDIIQQWFPSHVIYCTS